MLVRCEAAKAWLPFELRNGLVLTVEQSKGLEFDDVRPNLTPTLAIGLTTFTLTAP